MNEISPLPDRVIAAFGGLTPTANALGHKHVTTVDGWRRSGKIPHWRYPEIRAAASKADVKLPPELAEPKQSEAAE